MRGLSKGAGVLLLAVTLTGCGAAIGPTSTPTSSPSSSASPTDTPTSSPAPAAVAGFELGGSELTVVDAAGIAINRVPLDDATAILATLTAFHGEPHVDEESCGGDPVLSVWPDERGNLVVASHSSGQTTIVVKEAGFGIEPSVGPGFGESVAAFVASLPPDQVSGAGYVYDVSGSTPDGRSLGAVSFFDGDGLVSGLVSPSVPFGGDLC